MKAKLEEGRKGITLAMSVLSEFYGKDGTERGVSGAGGTIIGMLEMIEADLSKEMAEITSDEEAAVAEYKQVSSENAIQLVQKGEDVKYKTRESKQLDKASAESTSDRTGVQAQLSATSEYLAKLEEDCLAKPATYEERK